MLCNSITNEQLRTLVIVWIGMFSQSFLDALNLLRNSREHTLLQSVELIKAAPCTYLAKSHKDASHCLHVEGKSHGSCMIILAYG